MLTRITRHFYAVLRRVQYSLLSNALVKGKPIKAAPLLAQGKGLVSFGKNVRIGWMTGKAFWNTYVFCEARESSSQIIVGDDTWIGNDFTAVSEGPGVFIGNRVIIGIHVDIYDSDFHELNPSRRLGGEPKKEAVVVGDNVWIGNRVMLLKGTEIGADSIVAAGAVVSGKFPPKALIGGVPARVIRLLD